ncbi:MAG: class I SAM-dependent methyltransferase [Deltaproteobacteria bacterium]|jgi:SAM-dependent methyltransferase|nr:class I SAM-dependent methyltransferase [Deltaproteobacteria bacterium]
MDSEKAKLKEFWNKRAQGFPRYNEAKDSYENSILQTAMDLGVNFKGQRVLDVGCGSGMYTLKIALMAQSVVAVDISEEMLEISRLDSQKLGLENITYVLSDWADFEPKGQFDVVFCSMCPPTKEDPAKAKLIEVVGSGSLVYIGFKQYTDPKPLGILIDHYNLTRKTFQSGPDMRRWLEGQNLKYKYVERNGHWTNEYSREVGLNWCQNMLSDLGCPSPDIELIEETLKPFWIDEIKKYRVTTPYSIELIVYGLG